MEQISKVIDKVIEPENLIEVLSELLKNEDKILVVGSPTGGKTTKLIEFKNIIEKEFLAQYIHAHKFGSNYYRYNNVHEIGDIKENIKLSLRVNSILIIIIIDDIYRALARAKDLKDLKEIFEISQGNKNCKIILVTTVHRWNWLLKECYEILEDSDKAKWESNVLRKHENEEVAIWLAKYFINFNEECKTILVGYDEDSFKRALEKYKRKYTNRFEDFKRFMQYPLKFYEKFKEKNDNLEDIENHLRKKQGKVVIFPVISVIDKIAEIAKDLTNIKIAEKTMIAAETIGETLKRVVEHELVRIKDIISAVKEVGEVFSWGASIILPTVPFASALIIAGYLRARRGESFEDIAENFREIKKLPEHLLERKEVDHDLPPLTLESIQIAFNSENYFEEICKELDKVRSELDKLSELKKIHSELNREFKNIDEFFGKLAESIKYAQDMKHPIDIFVEELEFNLKIPSRIYELKNIIFNSDKSRIDDIIYNLKKGGKTIFVILGEAGSGKTSFIYNLAREVNKKIGKVLVTRTVEPLRFEFFEVLKRYLNLFGDDINILYCISKDSVGMKVDSEIEPFGRLELENLKEELIVEVFRLFDGVVIECRKERYHDLKPYLEKLKSKYKISVVEITKDKYDIKQMFNKFVEISEGKLKKESLSDILEISSTEKTGRYNLFTAFLACLWLYNGRKIEGLNRITFLEDFVKKYYEYIGKTWLWKLASLVTLSRGFKNVEEAESVYTSIFGSQDGREIPDFLVVGEEVRIMEIFMDVIFRVLIKEDDRTLRRIIGSDSFVPYYRGVAENLKLTVENLIVTWDVEFAEKLLNFINHFIVIQKDKWNETADYPNIYVECIRDVLKVLCEIKERIEQLGLYENLPEPQFPEPRSLNWDAFIVKSFVDENINKISLPLVAPDNVSFEFSTERLKKYLPECYVVDKENKIEDSINDRLESFTTSEDWRQYLWKMYVQSLDEREQEKEREKLKQDIGDENKVNELLSLHPLDTREFARKLLDWTDKNYFYDKEFALNCLYLWKIIYGKINPRHKEEYKLITNLEDKGLVEEERFGNFRYLFNFKINIDKTVRMCKNLPDYFEYLDTFNDSPSIHFLKNLADNHKEEYIIPQFDARISNIIDYNQMWFSKKVYEAGALKILMTLGGAWILKEDSFLYKKGREDFAMLIQYPFQEKVLAELMNLQNLKYPYEMIRNYSKWLENGKKVKFVWIRESIQPVCNVMKLNRTLLDMLEKELEENHGVYWNYVKERISAEEGDVFTQFQIHDQFVRTRTTAVQILPKTKQSTLSEIIEKFTVRQLVLKEILENEDITDILETLKELYPNIENTKKQTEKTLKFDLHDSMITELKNPVWLTHPDKWIRYGESKPFEVLNPLLILVREFYIADLMLKIIDCYIKMFKKEGRYLECFYLLLSKYSILWFLDEHYEFRDKSDKILQNIKENIIKNVKNKFSKSSDEDKICSVIEDSIKELKYTFEDSISNSKILDDYETLENIKEKFKEFKEHLKEEFWEEEIEWLFELIEKFRKVLK